MSKDPYGAIINRLSDRVRNLERLIENPVTSLNLVDDVGAVISSSIVTAYNQPTAPFTLNQSTDVGSEWINSTTGVISWWDGIVWQLGSSVYSGRGDTGALGPAAIVRGRTFILVTTAAAAPVGPSVPDIWHDTTTSTWKQWQGSSWVVITDALIITSLAAQVTTLSCRINFASAAPGTHNDSDLWWDTDDWTERVWKAVSSSWSLIIGTGIGTSAAGDGSPPPASPTPVALAGIESVYLSWTAVPNADPVSYDIFANSANVATADAAHYLGTTQGTTFVATQKPSASGGGSLGASTFYYYIVARDTDGSAAVGGTLSVTSLLVQSADITSGAVITSLIGPGAITTTTIANGAITTPTIAAGAITANELAAGAVTANKLNITAGGGNYATNASFENTSMGGGTVGTATRWALDATQSFSGTQSVKVAPLAGDTGNLGFVTAYFPVGDAAGLVFTYSAWLKRIAGAGNFRIDVQWADASQTFLSTSTSANATTANVPVGGWVRLIGTTAAAPANTKYARLRYYFTSYVAGTDIMNTDAVQLEIGDTATAWAPLTDEIRPGTIVAAQIATGTITSTQIAAGTIVAGNIATGTITATQIAGGTITGTELSGTAIDGKTITGAIVRTASTGNSIRLFNSGGQGIIEFDSGNVDEVNPGIIYSAGDPAVLLFNSSATTTAGNASAIQLTPRAAGVGKTSIGQGLIQLYGGIVINNTTEIQAFDFGAFNGNTSDSNGTCTVTHALGINPVSVQVTTRDRNRLLQVFSISSTQFVVRALNADVNTFLTTGTSVQFFWTAFA